MVGRLRGRPSGGLSSDLTGDTFAHHHRHPYTEPDEADRPETADSR